MKARELWGREYVRLPLVAVLVAGLALGYAHGWRWWQARAEASVAAAAAWEVAEARAREDFYGAEYDREETGMADWRVQGAGDATYNGDYTEAGTHGGKPYYANGSGRYLFWATPNGRWELLDTVDDEADKAYEGALGEELPANPWLVDVGTPPAPTVSAPPPDVEQVQHLRNAPRDMSVARMEWCNVSGTDYLFVLGKAQATGDTYLDRYDPATNTWTAGVSAVPDAVRDAAGFDTCTNDGKLYVGLRQPPGSAWALWEYDPVGDTWTERAAFNRSPNWYAAGDGYRVVSQPALTRIVFWAGGIYGGVVYLTSQFVDTSTWSASGNNFITPGIIGAVLEACLNPWSDLDPTHFVWGTGSTTHGDTWRIRYNDLTQVGHNTVVGAEVPELGLGAYYLFGGPTGQSWRLQTNRMGTPPTSHDISGVLCAAGLGDDLYVLAKPGGAAAALYLLDTRPRATNVAVVVVDDDATVSWTFEDADLPADAQSAFRVVVTGEGGGVVHDSTKTVSTAASYLVETLANGAYIAQVTLWDSDDQDGPVVTQGFIVGGAGAEDDPPTVAITDPAPAATITANQDITAEAADDNGIASVKFYVAGTLIGTLTAPNDGDDYTVTWQIAGYPNGSKTITVIAMDTAGQTAQDTITVTLDSTGDTEDPQVSIISPAESATVSGVVAVRATATDNVKVVKVNLFVDGQLQDTLTAPNDGAGYALTWDSSGWANGTHTIRVTAWDGSNNIGYDEHTVTLDRSKALSTLLWFSNLQPQADVEGRWREGVTLDKVLATVIPRAEVPEDWRERYLVQVGVHVPGNSVDFTRYQIVEPNYVTPLEVQGSTLRWAMCATPQFTQAYWEIEATAALRLLDVSGYGAPVVLTEGDAALWRLLAGEYALWEVVGLSAPTDAAYSATDGKIFCVGGAEGMVVKDLDTGEVTFVATLPGATGYTAVAAGANAVLVGAQTATGARLYSFSYAATTSLGDLGAVINRIGVQGQVAALGLADGTVWRWPGSTSALTRLVETGTDGVYSVLDTGGVVYAGCGDSTGPIWKNLPDPPGWALDSELGAGKVRAFAQWQGLLFAAGIGDGAIWRRTDATGWAQWHVLDGVTTINDLLVDSQGRLWAAAEHSGGARVYRFEIGDSGLGYVGFAAGVEVPDFLGKVVSVT